MAGTPLAPAVVRQILELVDATARANPGLPGCGKGRTIRGLAFTAYRKTGVRTGTVTTRFDVAARRDPALWALALQGRLPPRAEGEEAGPAIAPTPQPTLGDAVAAHGAQVGEKAARAKLREAYDEIGRLQAQLREHNWARDLRLTPPAWTLKPRSGEKSEHMPLLITSDFQVGEVIRQAETDHAHGYDVATFRRRYRRLIETAIHLCFHHQAEWTFPGIVYERLGDTISGGIHDELAETDELTPIEAVTVAAEEEAAGISQLAQAFGRVLVMECGGGNHDRDTKKPRSKQAGAHSFDRLVSYILRLKFQGDERVAFQGTESPDIWFPVYDM
ncbi:MAG: hypothetical protein JSR98_00710, partial [Proteobacteria bacterium]|nr:hypothetical protein [Pseudomonadota bacterium]